MEPEDRLACLEKVKSLAKTPEQKSWLGKLLDKIGVGAAGFGVGAIVALGVAVWLMFNSRKTE
jgi:tartrate dehydratase alpha subunit/fumarate hydratase class I-like protein